MTAAEQPSGLARELIGAFGLNRDVSGAADRIRKQLRGVAHVLDIEGWFTNLAIAGGGGLLVEFAWNPEHGGLVVETHRIIDVVGVESWDGNLASLAEEALLRVESFTPGWSFRVLVHGKEGERIRELRVEPQLTDTSQAGSALAFARPLARRAGWKV